MALVLNYSAASSDLPAFLANWTDNFEYRGDGWFNQVRNGADQWLAGTPGSAESSVIVTGNDFSLTPGVVDGTVTTMALGSNLTYGVSPDAWSQTAGLSVDFSGATLTTAWNDAVSDLSDNGSLDGLYAYFAEQGTVQNGTAGDDVLLSFGGDDEFTGGLGNDTFVFGNDWANDTVLDLDTADGNDDVLDFQSVTEIGGYADLVLHHSNFWDWNSTLTITVGSNTLALDGYVGTDIFNLIAEGNILV